MQLRWTICDAIAPFFRTCDEERINWSKIPFSDVERAWASDPTNYWMQLHQEFSKFCQAAKNCGFNVITLDDCAHLYIHSSYPDNLKSKIAIYRENYACLFDIANRFGLEVWITTDLVFWNKHLQNSIGGSSKQCERFFIHSCHEVLRDFPLIKGLVLRFGESDGKDVQGDFISKLLVRTPQQMRRFLQQLLPTLEKLQRWCILRTWSVGVYAIGDLIWNPRTLEKALKGIQSPRLVLSMKYGESDFFRYLPLNPCFWTSSFPKIIELQGRREYEGAGRFPSFIGYEYEVYRNELSNCLSLAGIMVWTQTGGWTRCRRLTFLDHSGLWNELNVRVTVALFQSHDSCDEILNKIQHDFLPHLSCEQWLKFCHCSHEVIRRLFYVEDFALQRLFFRRVRVPPMIGITWDTIWIHPLLNEVIRPYLSDPTRWLANSWQAVTMVEEMMELLGQHEHQHDLRTLHDFAEICAISRQLAFGSSSETYLTRLQFLAQNPEQSESYRCQLSQDFKPKSLPMRRWLKIFLRDRSKYRFLDHLITLRLMAVLFPFVYRFKKKSIPKDLRDQAMGIESLFK